MGQQQEDLTLHALRSLCECRIFVILYYFSSHPTKVALRVML